MGKGDGTISGQSVLLMLQCCSGELFAHIAPHKVEPYIHLVLETGDMIPDLSIPPILMPILDGHSVPGKFDTILN